MILAAKQKQPPEDDGFLLDAWGWVIDTSDSIGAELGVSGTVVLVVAISLIFSLLGGGGFFAVWTDGE